ncbi:MAG: DUF3570 domain-containing protein [Proteobacteria bacterium]|nr:DUF3570 domain-containing protein [Pseudomonadota bacterium]
MKIVRVDNRKARRRAGRGRRRTILASLSSAALALLGTTTDSRADGPVEKIEAAYAFSFYSEDSIKESDTTLGDTSRYEIQTQQVTVAGPLTDRSDVAFDFIYESMSGATPWYVQPGTSGEQPVQAMSGATVTEKRYDGTLRGNYYFDNARTGAHFGVSGENDYLAIFSGVNGEYHFNEKNTTLSGGLSFSIDEVKPTEADSFGRDKSDDKQSVSLNGGFSQILNRSTTFQTSISYKHGTGFLSDPYKKACIAPNTTCTVLLADNRPDTRNQVAWLTQVRRHFEPISASLHADYRFHYDDWKLTSHTFEVKWFQNFFDDLVQVVPTLRYYSQSQAYFYEPFYIMERSDGLASSDYRLSPYGSVSFGAKVQVRMEDWLASSDWRLGINYERHIADADFALSKAKVKNPGLVNYHFVYVTADMKF